jgi:hypothetical protein
MMRNVPRTPNAGSSFVASTIGVGVGDALAVGLNDDVGLGADERGLLVVGDWASTTMANAREIKTRRGKREMVAIDREMRRKKGE